MNKIKKLGMGLLLGAFFVTAGQSLAFADDVSSYRESIHKYQDRMNSLTAKDTGRYNSEMSTISEWIEQALILIGKNELSQVKSLVVKTGVYLDYVEVSVQKDEAMGQAMTAETELKALKAEYGKLEAAVQQLEAEEDVLTKKLESIQKTK